MSTGLVRRTTEKVLGPLTVNRRLPHSAGNGVIVVSGKVGGLKYLFRKSRQWDPELLNIAALLVRKGDSVWDVGANVGLFSKAAAFHAGAEGGVVSIEADVDAVTLLNHTCHHRSPGHAGMTVLPVAVSDSIGFVRFAIAMRARAANAIEGFGSTQTGGVREVRTLPCVTLDSLLEHFPAPNVLKIDVEGAELGVMRGAHRVLNESRPVIYCEVSDQTRDEIARLLESCAYSLWDGSGFDGASGNRAISTATSNLVAIPKEQVEKVFASK